ncbi:MAG: DMT family transporter, partial [Desulfobacterales bacterium]|nr:DMT family transporter [Desulfobacterales bacterium]
MQMIKTLERHQKISAMAGLVLAVSFWGINSVVAKGVIEDIPPMALSFYRWVAALVFLFPFAWKRIRAEKRLIRENLWVLFWLALPSVTIYNSLLYLGALYTTATNISLVVAAMPALTLGVAWLVNNDRPKLIQSAGIALSMSGVVAIVAKGSMATVISMDLNPGDILVLISIFSWAVYSVLLRRTSPAVSPISFLFMTIVFGLAAMLPFYLWELYLVGGFAINRSVVLVFIFLGICPSILSYILWNQGVKKLGAATASVFVYLVPLVTSAVAYVYLGERLLSYHFTGGAMILAGLVFSSRESGTAH